MILQVPAQGGSERQRSFAVTLLRLAFRWWGLIKKSMCQENRKKHAEERHCVLKKIEKGALQSRTAYQETGRSVPKSAIAY
jgi:hypothetical protein